MTEAPSKEQLDAACCWDANDRVPGRPELTAFRRELRYHQATWREANGHPIGTQPIVPREGKPSRPVGTRLPLDHARETGATFLTPAALEAARARTSFVEAHQSFDHQRLWADLLWSPALAFNLFGDLAADLALANRVVHAWWPDVPGTVIDVRFAHSPGRFDPEYLDSLRAFDAAFVLAREDGTQGIVAVDVEYHDYLTRGVPKPSKLRRYLEVAARSGVFRPGATDQVTGSSELCVMWLEHLLLLSMLQHRSGAWTWGRYVVLHPAGNSSIVDGCARYRGLLSDRSTFASASLEELLEAGVLPANTTKALQARYLPYPLSSRVGS